jgi:NADH-quinone oxidoreductase subunit M
MTLSILIWLPAVIALIAAQLSGRAVGRANAAGSVITLGIAISFLARFKLGHAGLQFVTDKVWISALGIHYKLGLDGLNVALVVLTTALFTAALVWSTTREWERPRLYYFFFGLAESAVLGAFCAQDLALFVVFFDLMLIPFYFLIGMSGAGGRPAPDGTELRALGAAARTAVTHLPGLDLPLLRGRLPGQDAAGAVPRLAA